MSIEWVYCSCLENCTEKIGSAMHVPIFFQLKNSSGPSGWHICAMSRNVLWSGWANTFQVDECGGSPHPWNILELSRAERNSGSWDVESWRQESMTQHSSFGSIRSRRRHDPAFKMSTPQRQDNWKTNITTPNSPAPRWNVLSRRFGAKFLPGAPVDQSQSQYLKPAGMLGISRYSQFCGVLVLEQS